MLRIAAAPWANDTYLCISHLNACLDTLQITTCNTSKQHRNWADRMENTERRRACMPSEIYGTNSSDINVKCHLSIAKNLLFAMNQKYVHDWEGRIHANIMHLFMHATRQEGNNSSQIYQQIY